MTANKNTDDAPIEAWITADDNGFTYAGRIVHADETATPHAIESRSMRGAQAEVTNDLIRDGYQPDGRWSTEANDHGNPIEVVRRFRHTHVTTTDA